MLTGLYKNILAIDCQYHGENIDVDNGSMIIENGKG